MVNGSVAVVVLNWNSPEDTLRCIESLKTQSLKDFTTIVVDNGSTDKSFDTLHAKLLPSDSIVLLTNDSNLGFAGGVNTGISHALEQGFEFIALLNNDAVASPNWLESLVRAAKKKDAAIVTSLILTFDGQKIDTTGECFSSWGLPFPRQRDQDVSEAMDSGFVSGASGGASLYRASLFKTVGLFDERFFAYYEDVDISLRSLRAGYKIYYEKSAVVYHERGSTSSRMKGFTTYQTFKNLPYVIIKNVPLRYIPSIGPRFLLAYILMLGKAIAKGRGVNAAKGLLVGMVNIFGILRARRRVNRQSDSSYDFTNAIYFDLPPDQTGMRKLRKLFLPSR